MTTAHVAMFTTAKRHLESAPHGASTEGDNGAANIVVGGFASPVSDHYKKADLAPFEMRMAAAQKCIDAYFIENAEHEGAPKDVRRAAPWLALDGWEGAQPQYTRTFYVLQNIAERVRAHYADAYRQRGELSQEEEVAPTAALLPYELRVYFVCGGDLFETFYRPGVWDLKLLGNIFQSFYLCVAARLGSKHPLEVIADFNEPLVDPKDETIQLDLRDFTHKVDVFELPANETSSTKVRALLRELLLKKDTGIDAQLLTMIPRSCIDYLLATQPYANPSAPHTSSW